MTAVSCDGRQRVSKRTEEKLMLGSTHIATISYEPGWRNSCSAAGRAKMILTTNANPKLRIEVLGGEIALDTNPKHWMGGLCGNNRAQSLEKAGRLFGQVLLSTGLDFEASLVGDQFIKFVSDPNLNGLAQVVSVEKVTQVRWQTAGKLMVANNKDCNEGGFVPDKTLAITGQMISNGKVWVVLFGIHTDESEICNNQMRQKIFAAIEKAMNPIIARVELKKPIQTPSLAEVNMAAYVPNFQDKHWRD